MSDKLIGWSKDSLIALVYIQLTLIGVEITLHLAQSKSIKGQKHHVLITSQFEL